MVEGIAWEWIFWINVPIGLIAAPLALARIAESRGADGALDLPGLALISARRVRGRLGPRPRATRRAGAAPRSLGALAAGLALLAAFVAWERRAPAADAAAAPLPQPRLRGRQRGDLLHVRAAVQLRVPVRAVPADRRSATARSETGLRLMPWTITFILVAPAAGRARRPDRRAAADRRPAWRCTRSASPGWRCSPTRAWPTSSSARPLIVAGIGVSMAIPSGQNAVVRRDPARRRRQGRGRELDDARARRRVRDRGRGRRVRRRRRDAPSAAAFADGFAPAIASRPGSRRSALRSPPGCRGRAQVRHKPNRSPTPRPPAGARGPARS